MKNCASYIYVSMFKIYPMYEKADSSQNPLNQQVQYVRLSYNSTQHQLCRITPWHLRGCPGKLIWVAG